jgi:hypothetical protein
MREYTKKQYDTDLRLLMKFKDNFIRKMKQYLPLEVVPLRVVKNPIIYPSQMLCVKMDKKEFIRKSSGDHIKNLWMNIFLSTDINPNGIDSPERVSRTWVVQANVKGDVKYYRCRTLWPGSDVQCFYDYEEEESLAIKAFLDWFDGGLYWQFREKIIK